MNPSNSEANSLPDRRQKHDERQKHHDRRPFSNPDSSMVEDKLNAGEQQYGKTQPSQCVSIGPALVELYDSYLFLGHLPLPFTSTALWLRSPMTLPYRA